MLSTVDDNPFFFELHGRKPDAAKMTFKLNFNVTLNFQQQLDSYLVTMDTDVFMEKHQYHIYTHQPQH